MQNIKSYYMQRKKNDCLVICVGHACKSRIREQGFATASMHDVIERRRRSQFPHISLLKSPYGIQPDNICQIKLGHCAILSKESLA